MQYPNQPACRRTYRRLQAHQAIRISTSVGLRLRAIAGQTGDITAIPADALKTRFAGCELAEAGRLVDLATQIRTRRKVGSDE